MSSNKTISNVSIILCSVQTENDQMNSISSCYLFFVKLNILTTFLEISLCIGTVIVNSKLIWIVLNKNDKTVFDKIYFCHAIVDLIFGGLDLPFYHIYNSFNFWPFSKIVCILWNTLDNAIITISILHMMFLSWARIESIRDPKEYLNKNIVKHPYISSITIWVMGLAMWFPVNYFYISNNFQYGQCFINYNPLFTNFVFTLFTFFLPLIIIVIMTIHVMRFLRVRQKNKKKIPQITKNNISLIKNSSSANAQTRGTKIKRLKLNVQVKMSIIIIVYQIQWIPSSIVWMTDALCKCVPNNISTFIHWLKFTVPFTDPILIIIFNPNYSSNHFTKKNKS